MLKELLILILFFGFDVAAFAQSFNTQMVLSARPTPVISDWANHPDILNYIITYSGPENFPVKIKVMFKDAAGMVIGSSNLSLVANRVFTNGTTVLQSNNVVLLQAISFNASIQNKLNASGRLPAGSYQLSLQIINAETLAPISEELTRPFNVISPQLPLLVKPKKESVLKAEEARVAIQFIWTPIAPALSQEPVTYLLQIFEVKKGQTPIQAYQGNQPLLNQQIIGVTQYIWHPQLYMLDSASNNEFIWTIQTPDINNVGFNNGVGDERSEPSWFYIKSSKEILEAQKPQQ